MKYLHRLAVLASLAVLLLPAAWQGSASAHELKEDNGVSAVLHIPPDDNPKSGRDLLLYFAFNSVDPDFNLNYCKCQVSYQATDNKLNTAPITQDESNPNSGYANINFETPGVYNLIVRGMVATDPSNTFELKFRVRAAAGTSEAETRARRTAGWQIVLLSITGLAIIGVVASEMIRRGDHYKKK